MNLEALYRCFEDRIKHKKIHGNKQSFLMLPQMVYILILTAGPYNVNCT